MLPGFLVFFFSLVCKTRVVPEQQPRARLGVPNPMFFSRGERCKSCSVLGAGLAASHPRGKQCQAPGSEAKGLCGGYFQKALFAGGRILESRRLARGEAWSRCSSAADSAGSGAIRALRLRGAAIWEVPGRGIASPCPRGRMLLAPQLPRGRGRCLTPARGGTEPFAPDKSLHS